MGTDINFRGKAEARSVGLSTGACHILSFPKKGTQGGNEREKNGHAYWRFKAGLPTAELSWGVRQL